MPSEHQAYIEIDECINDYLNESEQSVHKYFKLFHIAFRGMTELGLDFFYRVKSVKLPVNANLTVPLPNDYLNYSKVGVLNAQGEIIPMNYNSNLTYFADLQPQRLEQTQDNTLANNWYNGNIWWNYWNGTGYGNVYGLPSGAPFVGSFKIDTANGVILLSEWFGYEYLMLEYVSSPSPEGNYPLPIQFKEAMISYLRWKDIISIPVKSHMHNTNVEMRRREFYSDRTKAILRWKPVYLDEYYNANLQNTRLTVKI